MYYVNQIRSIPNPDQRGTCYRAVRGRDGEWMKVHLMLDSWLLAEYGIFDSAYLNEERECIRLFTQCKCKHTWLLKRWYVEEGEGATEVGFLAELNTAALTLTAPISVENVNVNVSDYAV